MSSHKSRMREFAKTFMSIIPPLTRTLRQVSARFLVSGNRTGAQEFGRMKHHRGLLQRAFVLCSLAVLAGLVMGGAVAVDCNGIDNCRLAAGNGTAWYGPGMMGAGNGPMMESVEISAMGGPLHDEMQGLVTKMMAGSLSAPDQARIIEIMNRYPGASNMMVTRMAGGYGQGGNGYPGMMGGTGREWRGSPGMMGPGGVYSGAGMMGGYGAGGEGLMHPGFVWLCFILGGLFFVVWLAVGILAIIWLSKQLQKDKVQP